MSEYALLGYRLGRKWYAPWRDPKMTVRHLKRHHRALARAEAREAFRLGWDRAADYSRRSDYHTYDMAVG